MKCLPAILCWCWLLIGTDQVYGLEAEDCVLYEGRTSAKSSPTRTMYHQISTGVLKKDDQYFSATLSLTSQNSNKKCDIMIMSNTLAVSCSDQPKLYKWTPEIFKEQDITEFWVHVGPLGGAQEGYQESVSTSTDLAIVGRRGGHRGHIFVENSGLQPPISVRWEPMNNMDYYYNCVTGCLQKKDVITPLGVHSFFFRPGPDFNHLSITYNKTESRTFHELSLNSSDFILDNTWKNMTVVWDAINGGIGVLVDGRRLRNLGGYSNLNNKRGVEAEIRGGVGLLRLCDPRFREVADAYYTNGENDLGDSAAAKGKKPGSGMTWNWLTIIALLCIGLLVFVATILMILLLKTKRDLTRERDISCRNNIAVDTFDDSRKGTSRSTAPLYPDVRAEKDGHHANSSPRDSIDGLKGPVPPVPNSNSSPYSFNGPKEIT